MVFKLSFWRRNRLKTLSFVIVALILSSPGIASGAEAQFSISARNFNDAQTFYKNGQYFKAARYAFAAAEDDSGLKPEAYALITQSLTEAGLYNSASYFFVRTLQSGNKNAVRKVLTKTQDLMSGAGSDLLRTYLIRHTSYDDYDLINRSAYLYALAKAALLQGDEQKAIGYLNSVSPKSGLW